jgi:NADH-quinone oxidoreductase subunit E
MDMKEMQEARHFGVVCEILKKYNNDKSRLIPILQAVQNEYRYLPTEVLTFLATSLGIPPAQVYGVATFYGHFTLEPKGKYIIRVCDGTACHVKKSTSLLDVLRRRLNLDEKRKTTPDMLFTLETVSCLGACGLAPVMVVNEDVYGQLTPEKAEEIIDGIARMEEENERNN